METQTVTLTGKSIPPMPPYMDKGSTGPFVNFVLSHLKAWCVARGMVHNGIDFDEIYGDVGSGCMAFFQSAHGLGTDGGLGPDTRAAWKEDGLDLEALYVIFLGIHVLDQCNVFVQPDGEKKVWPPPISGGTGYDVSSSNLRGFLQSIG